MPIAIIIKNNDKNNNEVNNIIGVIKGKDSSKAVVISAHLDHVTVRERIQETANINDSSQMKITKIEGAIDNASGVSVLLESAKDLASKYKHLAHYRRNSVVGFLYVRTFVIAQIFC